MNSNSYLYNSSGLRNQTLAPSNSASNLNSLSKYNFPVKENNQSGFSSMNRSKQLGLNPNLNIEDEYVENLLKQIHFMNMEIKLLKEKQSQSDNNALWGIINRTKQPLIKNIVESSQKYQDMKNNMDSQHQQLSGDNIKLADLQNAILKEYQYLETKITTLKKKKQTLEIGFKQKILKDNQKINEYAVRLKIITDQKQLQKKRNITFQNQLDNLITQGEKEQSKTAYELAKIRNDQIIQEQMEKQKTQAIQQIKNKISILKEKFLTNEDYQRAQEQQMLLRQKIGNLEKGISGANFQLLQLGESIKLAELQTQKQIRERKKLTQEFEAAKTMLLQISLLNLGRKQKQTQNRKRQSVQIQKAQYQTKKLQKNLDQTKKKLTKCQDTENQLRIEVQGLQRDLDKLKKKREELKIQLTSISAKNQQQDRTLLAYGSEVRKLDDQYQKVSNEQFLLTCELQSIEKEIQYLRGRKDYLNEALNLKDTLNQTRLEDLQRVVQKNIDLNETVNMLMSKWEEIKVFSRM